MGVNPYDDLVKHNGRHAVVSLAVTDHDVDELTKVQVAALGPMIRPLLTGKETVALDYGCGYGRFTSMLASMAGRAVGVDPCADLIATAPRDPGLDFLCEDPEGFARTQATRGTLYDVVFSWTVLDIPTIDQEAAVAAMVSLLAPEGIVVIGDHMPDADPGGRWVRFLPMSHYTEMFARHDIALKKLGEVAQLGNPVTVLAGRWEKPAEVVARDPAPVVAEPVSSSAPALPKLGDFRTVMGVRQVFTGAGWLPTRESPDAPSA
jgi:SAM-dependent methyltransferase